MPLLLCRWISEFSSILALPLSFGNGYVPYRSFWPLAIFYQATLYRQCHSQEDDSVSGRQMFKDSENSYFANGRPWSRVSAHRNDQGIVAWNSLICWLNLNYHSCNTAGHFWIFYHLWKTVMGWSFNQELRAVGVACLTLQMTKQGEYLQPLHCSELISKAAVEYEVLLRRSGCFLFLSVFVCTERRGEAEGIHPQGVAAAAHAGEAAPARAQRQLPGARPLRRGGRGWWCHQPGSYQKQIQRWHQR